MASVLEEKDAIRELIARYCFLIDAADYREWVQCFTEDGAFVITGMGTFQGRDTLLNFSKSIPLNAKGLPGFKHCTLNHIIEVDGERARARCYFLLVHEGDPLRVNIAGRYEDELAKQGGLWLFRKRAVFFDYQSLPAR